MVKIANIRRRTRHFGRKKINESENSIKVIFFSLNGLIIMLSLSLLNDDDDDDSDDMVWL